MAPARGGSIDLHAQAVVSSPSERRTVSGIVCRHEEDEAFGNDGARVDPQLRTVSMLVSNRAFYVRALGNYRPFLQNGLPGMRAPLVLGLIGIGHLAATTNFTRMYRTLTRTAFQSACAKIVPEHFIRCGSPPALSALPAVQPCEAAPDTRTVVTLNIPVMLNIYGHQLPGQQEGTPAVLTRPSMQLYRNEQRPVGNAFGANPVPAGEDPSDVYYPSD